MNKDVIYIESGDDITSIVSKIESSKAKIIALVPPEDMEVFRSIINLKLIIKAGAKSKKAIVLVTTDSAILKLAATLRIPVTKDLQTAPIVPNAEDFNEMESTSEEVVEEENSDKKDEKESKEKDTPEEEDKSEKTEEGNEEEKIPKKENKNAFLKWVEKYKKMLIFSGSAVVVLVIFLVWAFVIAPSATVTIEIRTAKNNFSENINFTSKLAEEDTSKGKFFLEEKTSERTEEKSVTATGKKNLGEKASGKVVAQAYFMKKGSIPVSSGTVFTISDLSYTSDEDVTLEWDGEDSTVCKNKNSAAQMFQDGCLLSEEIHVVANENGTKYNISAFSTGWKTGNSMVDIYSDTEMTGGTDKNVSVIQQSDIDKLKEKIIGDSKTDKEKLISSISNSSMAIESSYKSEITKIVVTPEIGQEIKENVKPTVKFTITSKIYALDKTKIEEFISSKAKLGEGYKIYTIDDPFVENFMEATTGYVGKLKTSYTTGAKITEKEIVEKIQGKGLGDAQHDLKNIEGISSIKIDTSFPWVNSIPNDTNKIFVNLDIK